MRDGAELQEVQTTLTAGQIAGGKQDIVASYSNDDLGPGQDFVSLFINGVLIGTATSNNLNDFDGGNSGGLGISGNTYFAGVGTPALSPSSGTIEKIGSTNNEFQYFFDVAAVAVPEPTTALGLLGLVTSAFFRRRRRKVAI